MFYPTTAKGHIDQRLEKEAEAVAKGEQIEGRYLTYFLSRAGMPMKSVYSNVTELLLAGVDTVRQTFFILILTYSQCCPLRAESPKAFTDAVIFTLLFVVLYCFVTRYNMT